MFYYTFTTFDCNFIPRNAEICKVSSETKNVGKAHKYRLNRHLPTYEKIIKNLYSFYYKKTAKNDSFSRNFLSGNTLNQGVFITKTSFCISPLLNSAKIRVRGGAGLQINKL